MRLVPISPDVYKGTKKNKYADFIDKFGGYNHNARINENEFYDMQNMSSDLYPIACARPKRGDIPASVLASVHLPSNKGMIYSGGFYYVSLGDSAGGGKTFIYMIGPVESNGQIAQDIIASWRTSDTNTVRKIIPMGAKLIVWPDNIVVNTTTPDQETGLNAVPIDNVKQTNYDATFQPYMEDGVIADIDYVGDDTPSAPADGYLWLDTSFMPASLKKYYSSSDMWQSVILPQVKITNTKPSGNLATSIGEGFSEGDGITISGVTVLPDLNTSTIIKKISEDKKSIIISAQIESVPDENILIPTETQTSDSSGYMRFICKCSDIRTFKGKMIQFAGNDPWKCTNATPISAQDAYTYEQDDSILSTQSTIVKSMQTIASSQTNSTIEILSTYIDDTGSSVSWTPELIAGLVGKLIRFGSNGLVAQIKAADATALTITLCKPGDTETPMSVTVAASTTIYGVSKVTHTDMKMGLLRFEGTHTIYSNEKGCPTLDTQYLQKYTVTENNESVNKPITFSRKMPAMDFMIEAQNRLWGCRYGTANNGEFVNEIYCSKLGDEKNWEVYQGIATDSYRASVGTEGEWTGAVNFRGYPVFFKERHIHSILGVNPPYQINSAEARGVQKGSDKSLAMLNEILYYKSLHGVCAYSGNLPTEVSYNLGDEQYKDAVACAYKNKYYICMKDMSDNPAFFVYDTAKGLWHKEDDLYVSQFASADNDVYFIKADATTGALFGTGGKDTNETDWYIETGEYGLSLVNSKYISRLNLRLALPVGSYMFISVMYDSSNEWETIGSVMGHGLAPFTLPVKPRRCDHFRLRLEGRGDMKLYSISKTISQGSDR